MLCRIQVGVCPTTRRPRWYTCCRRFFLRGLVRCSGQASSFVRGSRRRCKRAAARRAVWLLADWLVSAFEFLSLDCPNSTARIPRRLGQLGVADVHARALDWLADDDLAFGRLLSRPALPLSHCLERFENVLVDFESRWASRDGRGQRAANVVDTPLAMPVDQAESRCLRKRELCARPWSC
jgi:hypothetical protein